MTRMRSFAFGTSIALLLSSAAPGCRDSNEERVSTASAREPWVLNDFNKCDDSVFGQSVVYACNPSALGTDTRVNAPPFDAVDPPDIHEGHTYGVRLSRVVDHYEGVVDLTVEFTGGYVLYLGTPNVQTNVTAVTPSCSRYMSTELMQQLTGTDCEHKFLGAYVLDLTAGEPHQLQLGPIDPQNWVRVLLMPIGGPARITSVSAGYSHTCAVLDAGRLKCWGSNDSGELGQGDNRSRGFSLAHMGDALPEILLGTGLSLSAVTASLDRNCALFLDGRVKCWGGNPVGELGLGNIRNWGDNSAEMGDSLAFVNVADGLQVASLGAGDHHTCAITIDGGLKCWGLNSFAQFGLHHRNPRGWKSNQMGSILEYVNLGTGRTARSVAGGAHHTCAVLDDNSLRCWGCSSFGQLGLGYTDSCPPSVLGAELLPTVSLGTGRTAVAVTAGKEHTCALLDSGEVKCWGHNKYGQLGLGDTLDRGDEANEMGDQLPSVNLGTGRTARQIVAGSDHTCALLDDGSVKCWGYNTYGQLGQGDGRDRGIASGDMGDALPAVQLGAGRTAVKITAGRYHTCALLDDATLKCWGSNTRGQLGLGVPTKERIGDQPGEMGNALPAIYLGVRR